MQAELDMTSGTPIETTGRSKLKLPPKGSQGRIAYDYLLQGNTMTSMDAIQMFGILRLPNRISEMRKQYDIVVYQRSKRSPENKRVTWVEYSLFPFGD